MADLKTRWTESVQNNKNQVLQEYPRPSMKRESYINLNGLWDYAITDSPQFPDKYEGKILVPFSPEAPLSGVERQVKPEQFLWYHRILPEEINVTSPKRWLLHFGAADQLAAVYVNGTLVCRHSGGYLSFSADITDALNKTGENEIIVTIKDYSEKAYYGKGKQSLKPGGMFYTAQSGIWQTVWAEEVPETYIHSLKITPILDTSEVEITVHTISNRQNEKASITFSSTESQTDEINQKTFDIPVNLPVRMPVQNPHEWSPEDPFLYHLEVTLNQDKVESYFAMRKVELKKDAHGFSRLFLNHMPYFLRGVLDQGYWPDGLYTAPSDEALIFDIKEMKRLKKLQREMLYRINHKTN